MSETFHLLFVCTGNTGRSMMAEALAKHWCKHNGIAANITSSGLAPNPSDTAPEREAVHLLTQRGLDVSTHYAQAFTEAHGRSANLILTATQAHKAEIQNRYPNLAGKTFTISEYAIGRPADIADAFGQNAAFYQRTIEQIDAFIAPALRRAMGKEPR